MKKNNARTLKPLLLAVACLAFINLSPEVARADEVTADFFFTLFNSADTSTTFTISTSGGFIDPANPDGDLIPSLNGLRFQGTSIGPTLAPLKDQRFSFGSFRFTSGVSLPQDGTFRLDVNMTNLPGADPSSFSVIANINFDSERGVLLITPHDNQLIFFNGGLLVVTPSEVEMSIVPEPATLVLLGAGLAGVAGAARRRARGRPHA